MKHFEARSFWLISAVGALALMSVPAAADSVDRGTESQYICGVEVRTHDETQEYKTPAGNTLTYSWATSEQVQRFLPQLRVELGIYPRTFLQKCQLKKIALVAKLKQNGLDCGGVSAREAGVFFLDIGSWVFTVKTLESKRESGTYSYDAILWRAGAIHHELYHMMDLRSGGRRDDPGWAAMNPESVKYGTTGLGYHGDAMPNEDLHFAIRDYCFTAVEEDKAVTFEMLAMDPDYVDGRASRDSVIAAKSARIKTLVRQFCPEMDDHFWSNLRNARGGRHLLIGKK